MVTVEWTDFDNKKHWVNLDGDKLTAYNAVSFVSRATSRNTSKAKFGTFYVSTPQVCYRVQDGKAICIWTN